ncbi:MAG: four helix bundle protein [Candidatus Doudnabacteria bacterium]|nr:four helix bundle protein [Candidatus Doudnabacteria bacterium]
MQNYKDFHRQDGPKLKIAIKQRGYNFSLNIIKFIDTLNKQNFTVSVIIKQLLRSATSIGANIIEGQAASSRKDFISFLNYALKSANETRFWLSLLKDSNKTAPDRTNPLIQETIELANILAASLLTLRDKK